MKTYRLMANGKVLPLRVRNWRASTKSSRSYINYYQCDKNQKYKLFGNVLSFINRENQRKTIIIIEMGGELKYVTSFRIHPFDLINELNERKQMKREKCILTCCLVLLLLVTIHVSRSLSRLIPKCWYNWKLTKNFFKLEMKRPSVCLTIICCYITRNELRIVNERNRNITNDSVTNYQNRINWYNLFIYGQILVFGFHFVCSVHYSCISHGVCRVWQKVWQDSYYHLNMVIDFLFCFLLLNQ